MASERFSQQAFLCVSALLFVGSAALAIVWCGSMAAMDGMAMPGGWTMSMAWMRMPGQTWPGAAASFLAMWLVMMTAMMLPSLVPALWRYRRELRGIATGKIAVGQTAIGKPAIDSPANGKSEEAGGKPLGAKRDLLTLLVGAGYFLIWTAFGLLIFPLGAALAKVEMQHASLARLAPSIVCIVFLLAGALQFTGWKAHHLARCREVHSEEVHSDESHSDDCALLVDTRSSAWRYGMRLGLHCSYSSAGLTAILLVCGVMDLRAMALVTAAITVERLAPNSERIAQIIGAIAIAIGLLLMARQI